MKSSVIRWLEYIAFLLTAISIYLIQNFSLGLPNVSLIFDSQGYLANAAACAKVINPAIIGHFALWCLTGMSEAQQAQWAQTLSPLQDLRLSGPVLPAILACFYSMLHKPIASVNWSTGVWSMILCQAAIVPIIVATASRIGNRVTGRIAGVLALLYAPFAINCGRILSETPACFFSALAMFLLVGIAAELKAGEYTSFFKAGRRDALCHGLLCGFTFTVLMLSRAPLLLLPPICGLQMLLVKRWFSRWANNAANPVAKTTQELSVSTTPGPNNNANKIQSSIVWWLSLIIAMLIVLLPWSGLKKAVTGQATISVDRHGAYNLFTGLNLNTDGFDVLPSRYVSHPEEYKKPMNAVVAEAITEISAKPLDFVSLLSRKIVRLIDSPWNDFATPFLGLAVWWQRFYHQLVLLLALVGAFVGLAGSLAKYERGRFTAITIVSTFALYHLIYCPFITMSRYFYSALPAVLVLAAYGCTLLFRSEKTDKPSNYLPLYSALAIIPGLSMIMDTSYNSPFYKLISSLADYIDNKSFGLIYSSMYAVVLVCLAFALFKTAISFLPSKKVRFHLLFVALAFGLISGFAWSQDALVAAQTVNSRVAITPKQNRTYQISGYQLAPGRRYFLMADLWADKQNLINNIEVQVNGHKLEDGFRPLFSIDASQRENLVYLKAFAQASAQSNDSIAQWWALEIPAELLDDKGQASFIFSNSENAPIEIGNSAKGCPYIFKTREFSWSKGFFANRTGEMRMSEYLTNKGNLPHILLLCVDEEALAFTDSALPINYGLPSKRSQPLCHWQSPEFEIARAPKPLLERLTIPLPASLNAYNTPGASLLIKVHGSLRSPAHDKGIGSLSLIETIANTTGGNRQEFSPQAPNVVLVSKEWQTVTFEDIVPLKDGKLSQLEILCAAKPWWEVLSYGNFKSKIPIEFKDISIEIYPFHTINLDKDKWNVLYPEP
jgi:hypothetical protein